MWDLQVVAAYLFGILLLYVLARLLFVPLKYIGRLLLNAVIGLILLLLFNWIGGYFGLHLAINPVTALVAGFLGVPGVVLLAVLRHVVLGI